MMPQQRSALAPYRRPAVRRRRPLSILGFSIREVCLILAITFPAMGTLFPLESYLAGSGLEGLVNKSPLNTTLDLTVALVYVFWLFSQHVPRALMALRRNWIIFAFVLWAMMTSRWAWDPGLSFNRSGRMLVFALYGVYLIEFLPYRRSMQVLLACLALSTAISFVMILGVPSLSRSVDLRGAWRGAMQHKNIMGGTVGIAFVSSLLAFYTNLTRRAYCVGLAFVSLLLLGLSNSATAILSAVVIVGLMGFLILVVNRSRRPLAVLFYAAVAAACVVAVVQSASFVLQLLGRDDSLTGRAEVWEFAHTMIDANPFWGYGNGAWNTALFKPIVLRELGWRAPNAHNAWLDFRLQLGLPGFLLAIGIWGIATLNLLRLVALRQVARIALPATAFVFISIRTYSETVAADPSLNDIFWIALAFASFAKALAEAKETRPRRVLPGARQGYAVGTSRSFAAGSRATNAYGFDRGAAIPENVARS